MFEALSLFLAVVQPLNKGLQRKPEELHFLLNYSLNTEHSMPAEQC